MFVEGILGCGSVAAAAAVPVAAMQCDVAAMLPLHLLENIYEDAFWVALRNV